MGIVGIFWFINQLEILSNLQLIENKNPFCKRESGYITMKKMEVFHDNYNREVKNQYFSVNLVVIYV